MTVLRNLPLFIAVSALLAHLPNHSRALGVDSILLQGQSDAVLSARFLGRAVGETQPGLILVNVGTRVAQPLPNIFTN